MLLAQCSSENWKTSTSQCTDYYCASFIAFRLKDSIRTIYIEIEHQAVIADIQHNILGAYKEPTDYVETMIIPHRLIVSLALDYKIQVIKLAVSASETSSFVKRWVCLCIQMSLFCRHKETFQYVENSGQIQGSLSSPRRWNPTCIESWSWYNFASIPSATCYQPMLVEWRSITC